MSEFGYLFIHKLYIWIYTHTPANYIIYKYTYACIRIHLIGYYTNPFV